MAAIREEILANFQACTGLDNLDECIMLLEQNEWDLQRAVSNVLDVPPIASTAPPPQPQPQPEPIHNPTQLGFGSTPFDDFEAQEYTFQPSLNIPPTSSTTSEPALGGTTFRMPTQPLPSSSSAAASGASTSMSNSNSYRKRMLCFTVEYRERNIDVRVPDSETVGTIKNILASEIHIPADKQVLKGFSSAHTVTDPSDQVVLSTLHLPKENRLFLLTPEINNPALTRSQQPNGESPEFLERLGQTFKLMILNRVSGKELELNYIGSRCIQEVKQDIYVLTSIPNRQQVWTGWPGTADDDTLTIAATGIGYPCHKLSVDRQFSPTQQALPVNLAVDAASDSDEDLFEDASMSFDDHIFVDDEPSRKFEPLLPTQVDDITDALVHFSREFTNRYSETHPMFYLGPIEGAFREAFSGSAKDRKLLAVYIHHEKSVQSNVFCSQVMCAETVVSYLSQNFVTWAWDITGDENKAKLLNWCTNHFGSVAATTVREFRTDQFPLLLVIMKIRSNTEVFSVLQGNVTLDGLMTSLISAVDVFSEHQQSEIREEAEREARETMKKEQDEAYQESLLADRAKEEARKAVEEQKLRTEREKSELEAEKEAIRMSLEDSLPDEPAEDCTEPIITIRVKLPNGQNVTRRFLAQNPLQILLNYVASVGYHMDEYKVLTNWPRRDLSQTNPLSTLEELRLCSQDTVFVEEY
ncbi:FAS-associated factor 1-like [Saccoglossus kowalevskii]|uniref:FAS-associated factor 1-like n=1 Tax=Saccoglossus kowalevskii TaxID=10224 RepID=A0ABM0GPK5_SACKO|nr:PREDICTED: FAS-associated factor 1-like [Saccoglossus kowalevskii]